MSSQDLRLKEDGRYLKFRDLLLKILGGSNGLELVDISPPKWKSTWDPLFSKQKKEMQYFVDLFVFWINI